MGKWLIVGLVILGLVAVGLVYANQVRGARNGLPEGITTAIVERGDIDAAVTSTGSLVPNRRQPLTFRATGQIAEVLVTDGDMIEAGAPLARLDTRDLELSLRQAQAALAAAEATLARAQRGPSPEELLSAEAAVRAADAQLQALRQGPSELDRQLADLNVQQAENSLFGAQGNRDALAGNPMVHGGQVTVAESQVLNAELAVVIARINREQLLRPADAATLRPIESQLAQARATLARLQDSPSPEEVATAEAQALQAQVGVDIALARLDDATLRAPFAGRIASWSAREGDAAAPGNPAGVLVDETSYRVEVSVDETELRRVAEGQLARIVLDAYLDVEARGEVSQVNLLGTSVQGLVTYGVTIDLEELELPLRPGMTAAVDIIVARKGDVVLLPNRALRRDTDGMYVELVRDREIVRADVVAGLSNDEVTEAVSGVEPGDVIVVTRPRENILRSVGPFGG